MVSEKNDLVFKNMPEEIEELRKKLLDMTLRNNLLNFKVLKRTVPIVDESIVELFKILVLNEKSMEFLPKEVDEEESLDEFIEDDDDFLEEKENIWTIIKTDSSKDNKYTDKYLQTDLTEKDLQKRLFNLFQNYKTSMTEQGFNNLYLALGFLEWNDKEYQETLYKAPLILIPVEISRNSVGSPFKVKWNQADIVANISLQNKLKEQNVNFPIFEYLEDENDLCNYFSQVNEVISHISDWNVSSEIYLSTFSFRKFVMYKDINLENWSQDSKNQLDKLLFNPEPTTLEPYDNFELDTISSKNLYQVLDADSSQMEVIEDVKKSNNLVVEGPPGTGKSQTIVNLIAELMANGKSILFVSEKMAALEVVKRRLDGVNLGTGCLELHSNKSNKRAVLDEINRTLLDDSYYINKSDDFEDLDGLKEELNEYICSLYESYGNTDFYPYKLFGVKEREQQVLEEKNQEILYFDIENLTNFDQIQQKDTLNRLSEISKIYNLIAPISENPWKNILPIDFTPNKLEIVKSDLKNISTNLDAFIDYSESLSSLVNCSNLEDLNKYDEYSSNLGVIRPGLSVIDDEAYLFDLIEKIEKYQNKLNSLDLNDKFSEELISRFKSINEDLSQLINNLDDISLNLICSNLDNFDGFEKHMENLSIIDPNLKIFENKYEVNSLVNNLKTYNENINSINLDENLPKIVDEYTNLLNELIGDISYFLDASNYVSDKTSCSKLLNFNQADEWISNLNLLNPEIKIMDDKYAVKNCINLVESFQDDINLFILNDFSNETKIFKENIYSFLNNLSLLNTAIADFNNISGVKINNLKSIERILDSSNILKKSNLRILDDNLEDLINKISQYQYYTIDLDHKIFELDLYELLSKINSLIKDLDKLSIQKDLILTDNGENLLNQFKNSLDKIKNLPFIDNYKSPDYIKNLEIIQSNRNSIFRDSNQQFMDTFKELKNYYDTDTDEKMIFDDVDLFLENNRNLSIFKNQNLRYLSDEITNDDIIKDLNIFIKIQDQFFDIKNKLSKFLSTDLRSVEDLQSNLVNLVLFKELYDFILSKDDLGKKYFGNLWNSIDSDVDNLINHYFILREFNDLYDSEIFTEETLNKISSFDKSLFLNNSNKIRNIKKDIDMDFKKVRGFLELNTASIYSKDIIELHSFFKDLYNNSEVLDKWESFKLDNTNKKVNLLDYDLQSVEHSVNELQKYSSHDVFSKINNEINNLSNIKQSKIEIDSMESLAESYFLNDWAGSNSNIDTLKERYEKLEKFNELVTSGFYTIKIEENIHSLNFIDLNLRLNDIQTYKDKILENIAKLNDLSLKNLDVNSIEILKFKEKLNDLLICFNDIKDWYGFKSSVGVSNVVSLYYYDFVNLNNSVNNLSYYFDCNEFLDKILVESSDLINLKNLKELIDSNEIGEKYFCDYWKGSSSDINEINDYFERLTKFNNLVISKFYTFKTEESLSKLNAIDFNDILSRLYSLKAGIFDNFNALNSLNIFKNVKFNSMPLKDLSKFMSSLVEDLEIINDWQGYKKDKKLLRDNNLNEFILDLFDYDFDKVNYSFSNLLVECNFNKELEKEINTISELKNLKKNIDDSEEEGLRYFKNLWNGVDSNIIELKDFNKDLVKFNQLLKQGFYTKETLINIETVDYEKFNELRDKLSDSNENIHNSFNELNDIFDFNELLDDGKNFNLNSYELKEKFDILGSNYDSLSNWRLFCLYSKENENSYLSNIIPLIWEDKIKAECIVSLFKFNVGTNILNEMIESDYNLRNFNEILFNEKRESFKELDKKILEINQYRVRQILQEKKPSIRGTAIQPSSELGILVREIDKKRRIMPIRKLLAQAANVIGKIKPCFMMSPISVAQYLDPRIYANHFDYVIFDEASQVKTEDAIGAFLRGKNFVIMGDSKQLPPTSFFDGGIDSEDEDESLYNDVESILKLCRTVFPDKMLKWHYRSRHESLISVSNYEFYNNDLIVFPSPFNESKNLGLKYIYNPDNVYDKGKSSKNRGEAKDVIEYAINHFKKYGKNKSLGIGTFGIKQKQAILEELELRLRNEPELEPLFDESGENGFFIKNLENIQGDERDVILISTGYGFDKDHKLTMNFGPLNHDGGERRLNVLITRAREKCVVFANFSPSDLRITEKSPFGIRAFKTFLCYAKHNKFPQNIPTGGDFDSPFEESVYNFLTANGYEVKKQIGCAGYRIDLAIVDPDNADKYVLGIECDGATYHSSTTARDRDRLRQQVLENLGWKFYRIWSTDWFNSRISAQKRLIEVVEKALANKDKESNRFREEPKYVPKSISTMPSVEYFKDYAYFKDEVDLNDYDFNSYLGFTDLVRDMVRLESPVHISDIYETMKIILGEERNDRKFKNSINSLLHSKNNYGFIYHIGNYYFYNSFDKNSFIPRKRKKPKLNRIYNEELKLAVINTLKLQLDAPKEDLIKASANNLGFRVVRENINIKFNEIIDELMDEEKIDFNKNGTIGLKE